MRLHPLTKLLTLTSLLPLGATSCLSVREHAVAEKSLEELEALKDTLGAQQFKSCLLKKEAVTLPVPIRQARLIWHEGSPVLVYEGVFREAIKSVWQPLKPDFSLNGDGVVIGQKEMPTVTDFQTFTEEYQGFWTSYRFKIPGSEMFAAAVEYLPKEKSSAPIVRLAMPQTRNSSALRVWVIPLPQASSPAALRPSQKGIAHVIVRTVSTAGAADEATESLYTWYLLHASKNLVKKMGEFRNRGEVTIEKFLLARDAGDPVAIGISSDSDDSYGTNAKGATRTSNIVAMRPFAPGQPQSILHSDDTNSLTNLTISAPDGAIDNMVTLAWVREPLNSSHPSLQIASSRLELPGKTPPPPPPAPKPAEPKGKKGKKKPPPPPPPPPSKAARPSLNIKSVSLNYVPTSLAFLNLGGQSTALTWWGGTADAQGLVMLKADKSGQFKTHAFAAREDLGLPMGVSIPPPSHPEGLLMYFATTSDNVATAGKVRFCAVARAQVQD